ncbi:MAG TPA: hypothetical protein VGC41_28200 [Kofleriaceae bacterium]
MKKLPFCLMMVFALAACGGKKDKPAETAGSGSAAMAGSGSAAMAGSGSGTVTGSDMGNPPTGSAAPTGSGSGSAAMAGSADGSGSGVGAAAGSAAAVAAGWDFDKLTHEEQMDFMKKQVVPTMKPLFQKFDPKHYANFGCKTCHGKDPQKSKFKMPTPDLPKLDFEALKAGKQKPEIAKWMGGTVEPEMAKLLQRPVYDPKAPDEHQFGCLGCHQQKK